MIATPAEDIVYTASTIDTSANVYGCCGSGTYKIKVTPFAPKLHAEIPQSFVGSAFHYQFFNGSGKFNNRSAVPPGASLDPRVEVWERTAIGHTLPLVGAAFKGATAVEKVRFALSVQKLNPADAPSAQIPVLYGWIFVHPTDEGNQFVIFNMSDTYFNVNVANLTVGSSGTTPAFSLTRSSSIGYEQYSCDDPFLYVTGDFKTQDYFNYPTVSLPQESFSALKYYATVSGTCNTNVVLPAFSITRVYSRKVTSTNHILLKQNKTEVCDNEAVNISAKGFARISSWSVSPNDATLIYDDEHQNTVGVIFPDLPSGGGSVTYTITAWVTDGGGNCSDPGRYDISGTTYVTVYPRPKVTISTTPDPAVYCWEGDAVQLSASMTGGSDYSVWWTPTEGLYDDNTLSALSKIKADGSLNIYARPLSTSGQYEDIVKYFARGIARITTTSGEIRCIDEENIEVKLAGLHDYRIQFQSTTLPYKNFKITICDDEIDGSEELKVEYDITGNNNFIVDDVTWYINDDPTTPYQVAAVGSGTLSLSGITESTWFVAKFMYGGCEKFATFDYVINPDAEATYSQLTCCTGEKLNLEGTGAEGKAWIDSNNHSLGTESGTPIYTWAPSTGLTTTNANTAIASFLSATTGTFTYTLTASTDPDDILCGTSAVSTIDIFNITVVQTEDITSVSDGITIPQTTFTMTFTVGGPDCSVDLTATSGATDVYYEWQVLDGALNVTTSASVTAWAGSYMLNMISLDNSEYGCCSSGLITVNQGTCIPVPRLEDKDTTKKLVLEYAKVYPNPTSESFYIEGFNNGDDEDAKIIISNLTGQVIYCGNLNLKHGIWKYESHLKEPGVYFVRIDTKMNVYRSTIISIKE